MAANLEQIAKHTGGTLIGDPKTLVEGLSPIDSIKPHHLVFATNDKFLKLAESSKAAAIIVGPEIKASEKPLIQVKSPMLCFSGLVPYFYPQQAKPSGIHPSAVIGENVHIGKNVYIGAQVVIGDNVIIGDNSHIKAGCVLGDRVCLGKSVTFYPNVSVYDDCEIGDFSVLHAGTVIGSDGFGYIFDGQKHNKIPHVGKVVIGSDVEIGANSVIDRATLGETTIGDGTKIDNLVQVAHNVTLGQHNILCAFTGIAGSVKTGENVVFAAGVGVADHVCIEDNVAIGARAGIPPKKHLPKGSRWWGSPAQPEREAIEQVMLIKRLPKLRKLILQLQKKLSDN